MKKGSVLFIIFFIAISQALVAQVQYSGWLASFNTFKLKKNASIHFDAQWRSSHRMEHMQTLLLRTGLNYKVSSKTTLTAGYAFISNRRSVTGISGYAPEHRIWQQAIVSHKIKKHISTAHRFRVEQRFIGKSGVENNELVTNGYNFANRFRYFIRNVIPLKKSEFNKGVFTALQNELFLNFGNTNNVNGKTFDQNRLYMAIGYKFNPVFSIDFGYLNHYTNGRNDAFVNNHVIQLAAYTSL